MSTSYVIFKRETDDPERWRLQDDPVAASSGRAAISHHVKETGENGVYAAVPVRSWRALTVKTETHTKLTIG